MRRWTLFATTLAFTGCSGYVWVEEVVPPAFDHSFIKTIAVPEFANLTPTSEAGKIMADRVEEILVNESGYKVVTRMEIARLMDEHKLSVDGHLDPKAINRLGRVGGVDALVLGCVEVWDFEEKRDWTKMRVKRNATVAATLKLVDSTSGLVVWSKRCSGNYYKDKLDFGLGKPVSPCECLEKAMDRALTDVRSMFPGKKKVRVRREAAP